MRLLTEGLQVRVLPEEPFLFRPKFHDPLVNGIASRLFNRRSRVFRNSDKQLAAVALSKRPAWRILRNLPERRWRALWQPFSGSPRGAWLGLQCASDVGGRAGLFSEMSNQTAGRPPGGQRCGCRRACHKWQAPGHTACLFALRCLRHPRFPDRHVAAPPGAPLERSG
jgi:hypothetical protein